MNDIVQNLKNITSEVLTGGGEEAIKRHTKKGKLLARERINLLVDKGSPFLEFSQLAGYELYGKDKIHSAGIITGIGKVQGYV